MGSLHSYDLKSGKRYRILYRRPDNTQTSESGFKTKKAAELRLAEVEVSKGKGEFIDAADSRATVRVLGVGWLAAREGVMKASSYRPIESAWRIHVEPKWGARSVGSLKHTEARND